MSSPIVLRRSSRQAILWDLHRVLDEVADSRAPRRRFVEKFLERLRIAPGEAKRLVAEISARLPEDIANADVGMDAYLRVFEELLPIAWHNDMAVARAGHRDALRQRLRAVLDGTQYPASPRAVSAEMVAAARELLGPTLDDAALPGVTAALEALIVSELWRCRDEAARTLLAERLADAIAQEGRVAFDGP